MKELVLNNGSFGFVLRFSASLNKKLTGKGFSSLSEAVSNADLRFVNFGITLLFSLSKKALVTMEFIN